MSEKQGTVATVVESVARIADAFDRLVTLAEDWSEALDLPHFGEEAEREREET